jgi:hypothetical protein
VGLLSFSELAVSTIYYGPSGGGSAVIWQCVAS